MSEDKSSLRRVLSHRWQQREGIAREKLSPRLQQLRQWQVARLERTYADLFPQPRYKLAGIFFLNDLYGPHDFSQRDHDFELVYKSMGRVLPAFMLRPLEHIFDLHTLTDQLDLTLLSTLNENDPITPESYAAAYRHCDNYTERVRQIEMLANVGKSIDKLVTRPFVATTLRLARMPAHLAGWHDMQDFLERGFAAFKRMGGADEFLQIVQQREMQILHNIYAGIPDPFEW